MSILKINTKNLYSKFLLFFYIFSSVFTFFPGQVRTRMLSGAWGFIKSLFGRNIFGKFIIETIMFNLLFILAVVVTYFVQKELAVWFIQHAILNIVYLFGGLYIAMRFVKMNISLERFLYFMVEIILIHNLIAFAGYVFEPLGSFIFNIQKSLSDDFVAQRAIKFHIRAFGFGVGTFFH